MELCAFLFLGDAHVSFPGGDLCQEFFYEDFSEAILECVLRQFV